MDADKLDDTARFNYICGLEAAKNGHMAWLISQVKLAQATIEEKEGDNEGLQAMIDDFRIGEDRVLKQQLCAAKEEIERRDIFLERAGHRRCDIAACNCNSWHGGHADRSLSEAKSQLTAEVDANDKIHAELKEERQLLTAREEEIKVLKFKVSNVTTERDVANLEIERLNKDLNFAARELAAANMTG